MKMDIRTIHEKILSRFDETFKVSQQILSSNVKKSEFFTANIKLFANKIEDLREVYLINIAIPMRNFCAGRDPEDAYISFSGSLTTSKVLVHFDELVLNFLTHLDLHGNGAFAKEIEVLEPIAREPVNLDAQKINYGVCKKCSSYMLISMEKSEFQCAHCHMTEDIVGTIFKENQAQMNDNPHKHITIQNENTRHCDFWLDRIQAIEKWQIGDEEYNKISKYIERNGIVRSEIDYPTMRDILSRRSVYLTTLNKHIPSLIKMFGGVAPPILNCEDLRIIRSKFIRAVQLHIEHINSESITPYYPYFIYKIIEREFKYDAEKIKILNFIHLQQASTLKKRDNQWKILVSKAYPGEFEHTPTDPNKIF